MLGLGLGLGINKRNQSGSTLNPFPLDNYPGATVIYGLKEMVSTWAGQPVIKVERSSNNAQADFTRAEIEDGTLTTWIGGGNGIIIKIYDQSGNNNDLSYFAGTYGTIVEAGVLVTADGRPGIRWGGSMTLTSAITAGVHSTFSLFNRPTAVQSGLSFWFNISTGIRSSWIWGTGFAGTQQVILSTQYGATASIGATPIGTRLITTIIRTTTGLIAIDGTINIDSNYPSPSGVGTTYNLYGRSDTGCIFHATVLYQSDETINRTAIDTAIANYYGITLP